ncbi:hypothetical protein [Gemmata palustris]|nr:hypothetical protein [Gemmata palustris]
MTEAEWLTCVELKPMWSALPLETCLRKSRLFMIACCRRHFHRAVDQECKEAIEVAERFADGSEQLQTLTRLGEQIPPSDQDDYGMPPPFPAAARWITRGEFTQSKDIRFLMDQVTLLMQDAGGRGEQAAQATLLLDIFGNPFRPIALESEWLTSTVLALAEGIYQDRAFDRMPILADALQDAGCDSDDVLTHCRGPGPHVRGCWVVDVLTGRK